MDGWLLSSIKRHHAVKPGPNWNHWHCLAWYPFSIQYLVLSVVLQLTGGRRQAPEITDPGSFPKSVCFWLLNQLTLSAVMVDSMDTGYSDQYIVMWPGTPVYYMKVIPLKVAKHKGHLWTLTVHLYRTVKWSFEELEETMFCWMWNTLSPWCIDLKYRACFITKHVSSSLVCILGY